MEPPKAETRQGTCIVLYRGSFGSCIESSGMAEQLAHARESLKIENRDEMNERD